jgi:hypothetical protein
MARKPWVSCRRSRGAFCRHVRGNQHVLATGEDAATERSNYLCKHALLAAVPLGFHLHLLSRDPEGGFPAETVLAAEEEADRLAYELLAPADEVLRRLVVHQEQDLAELLRTDFGLPAAHAARYRDILSPVAPADPLLKRLRLM